jgi:hypothetical protein
VAASTEQPAASSRAVAASRQLVRSQGGRSEFLLVLFPHCTAGGSTVRPPPLMTPQQTTAARSAMPPSAALSGMMLRLARSPALLRAPSAQSQQVSCEWRWCLGRPLLHSLVRALHPARHPACQTVGGKGLRVNLDVWHALNSACYCAPCCVFFFVVSAVIGGLAGVAILAYLALSA